MVENMIKQDEKPALWNPNAAASWCLIFTPAFGAYLHMLNWRTLGEHQRAEASLKWFYVGIALLVLYSLLGIVFANHKAAEGITRLVGFVFLLSWYFGSAKAQAKFIKERFGTNYTRKPWWKPFGFALIGILAFMTAIFIVAFTAAFIVTIPK